MFHLKKIKSEVCCWCYKIQICCVFEVASVEKSTVPARDALLVLLCRKALTQKERKIREDENGQTKCQDT